MSLSDFQMLLHASPPALKERVPPFRFFIQWLVSRVSLESVQPTRFSPSTSAMSLGLPCGHRISDDFLGEEPEKPRTHWSRSRLFNATASAWCRSASLIVVCVLLISCLWMDKCNFVESHPRLGNNQALPRYRCACRPAVHAILSARFDKADTKIAYGMDYEN